MIRLEKGDSNCYLLVDTNTGKDMLMQNEWDYSPIAICFGFVPCPDCDCDCDETDGTAARDLIVDARQYLDEHLGYEINDMGFFYFDE